MSALELNPVLRQALIQRLVERPDGRQLKTSSNISLECAEALYRFVRSRQPSLAIEVGMAHGVSTLSILTAIREYQVGKLISIDPYIDWPTGREVAHWQVKRSGLASFHEHRQVPSYLAFPQLITEGAKPGFVYIDGNHNFEYALTDLFFADKLLPVGGVVGFNDVGWRSVHPVVRFLGKYRRYRELDVGLPVEYRARNPLFSLIRRFEGRQSNDRYFEKTEEWEPPMGYWAGL